MFSLKPRIFLIFFVQIFFVLSTTGSYGQSGRDFTIKVNSNGRSYVGKRLIFDGSDMALMRRDGRISIIPVKSAKDIKTVSRSFKPFEDEEIRRKLQKEFGGKYQVSKTRNFVVVHPPGDFQHWAMPFEILYQRFRNYFSSRGFTVDEPEFPLVAVVLRKRSEFDKFLKSYHSPSANTLGYYSQKSNRIITYDPSGGRSDRRDWMFEDTLIHEAVHQTAYNTGIHRRFGATPSWIVEGLAMMFEAKGVHNSMYNSHEKDRINKDRLANLQHYYRKKKAQRKMRKFITGDQYFDADPIFAYAYSWGLTYFLAEKYPKKYLKFLQSDGAREEFRGYSSSERLKAFTDVFGGNFLDLESRMESFITKLKI